MASSAASLPAPCAAHAWSSGLVSGPAAAAAPSPLTKFSRSTAAYETYAPHDVGRDLSSSVAQSKRLAAQRQLQMLAANMTASTSTKSTAPFPKQPYSPAESTPHARLHKRGSSTSSGFSAKSPTMSPRVTSTETFPDVAMDVAGALPPSVTAKAKAFRRRRSLSRDDQGKLDLSRSTTETELLAGLGIENSGSKSVADVNFTHATRRGQHRRTQSTSSQSSISVPRATQPFVHPMRQTPRPYTPPGRGSYASSVNDEEAGESADVFDEPPFSATAFRHRRSMSVSSLAQGAPTPLSQSYIPEDLGLRSRLTSASQSNVSTRSEQSGKAQSARGNRPRCGTDRSLEYSTSATSRNSMDKALSFVSRRLSDEPMTRDERIRAARRKFEEREAEKDRKAEREVARRRESELAKTEKKQQRQRRQSATSDRIRRPSLGVPTLCNPDAVKSKDQTLSMRYDDTVAMSKSRTIEIIDDEKTPSVKHKAIKTPQGNWLRFSGWIQTRMMNCARG